MEQAIFKYAKYIFGIGGLFAGFAMYCLNAAIAAGSLSLSMDFVWIIFIIILTLVGLLGGNIVSRLYGWVYQDFLTGAWNRKYFSAKLHQELAKKRKTESHLCVALIDLDNFKKINDQHGHFMGDRVIKYVAKVMMANVRKSDAVIRFGGDEFAVVFPETGLNEARCALERIRCIVEQSGYVTISAGVIEVTGELTSAQLFTQVDEILYRAKQGKNSVCAMGAG